MIFVLIIHFLLLSRVLFPYLDYIIAHYFSKSSGKIKIYLNLIKFWGNLLNVTEMDKKVVQCALNREVLFMRYAIQTFGCKVNQYESIAIENAMNSKGFEKTENMSDCDIAIINSCTVTESSDKKARKAVRVIKRLNPNAIVVLSGCYPQAFFEEAKTCGADIVLGTSERMAIPDKIKAYFNDRKVFELPELPKEYEELDFGKTTGKTRAFIKIEDGCNRFCSYCIIPYARGRVRSRSLESIRDEVLACIRDGHKEIVLVGINLSCFGSDIGKNLADAVELIAGYDEIERIRLSSLEPELLDEEMLERLSKVEKLCSHFHLSLQSGCDETLKRMNRHYTSDEYYDIVCRIRKYFNNPAITTDIMVGFAGETDEEFEKSLAFARRVEFAKIHVFTYSVREGTAAAKRTNHIPEHIKNERYKRMSELDNELHKAFLESHIGLRDKVLVQKRTSPEYASGLTPDYTPVRIPNSNAKKHDIIEVEITGTGDGYCIGKEI